MPLMYRLGGLILALAALVGGALYIGHLRTELRTAQAEAQKARHTLQKTQATLASREKQRAAMARETASAHASLSTALASVPDPETPKEVQDALCATLACVGPDGLREPSNDSP